MLVLALDTALSACQAAVRDGERTLAALSEPMERGHQERLAPMVQAVMAAAEARFDRLERVGVTVGPGSFTGLRVGIAFAKGLALALDIPGVGIGTLEALAAGLGGVRVAVIDARRDQVYLQAFEDGRALTPPKVLPAASALAHLTAFGIASPDVLVGPGAPLLQSVFPHAAVEARSAADPATLAGLVAARATPLDPLQPLYLRAPDARTIAERAAVQA